MKKLIFTLLFFLITTMTYPQTATQPSVGDGSEGNPYQIENLENLYWIADDNSRWNYHYLQTSNIDASATSGWNGGEGWIPIGNNTTQFEGSYDGGGHTISNLYINRSDGEKQGLFGYIKYAEIANLGFINTNITCLEDAGALAGWSLSRSTIDSCYSQGGTITAETVGSLIGYAGYSTIRKCYGSSEVNGRSSGGLIGSISSTTLSNSFATGNISVDVRYSGGLVSYANNSSISNCYSTGSVEDQYRCGGLIGYNYNSTITNSFWDKETSGLTHSSGGTGKSSAEMKDISTYLEVNWDFKNLGPGEIWNIGNGRNSGYPYLAWRYPGDPGPSGPIKPYVTTDSVTGITETDAIIHANITTLGIPSASQHGVCWNNIGNPTTADNKTEEGAASSAGYFSSTINGLSTNTTYYIKAYATNSEGTQYGEEITIITCNTPEGVGNEANPYQIASLADLYWISNHKSKWDKHYIQTDDIDASETSNWNGGKGFVPVGTDQCFSGSYNGNFYSINDLYINRPQVDYVGMFSYIQYAVIKKVKLKNADITGKRRTGILSGSNFDSNVDSCHVSGQVTGTNYTGGLIGNNRGTIKYSSSDVNVTGNDYVGGMAGQNFQNHAKLSSSFSYGIVNGNSYVGGLVGRNSSSSVIENSFSRAEINGNSFYIGGFVGENYAAEIYNSYSAGSATGNSNVGGFAGSNYYNTIVKNCFWDKETSGLTSSAVGTGKTTNEMKEIVTFTDTTSSDLEYSWDFIGNENHDTCNIDIWGFADTLNNSYPLFNWQYVTLNYDAANHGSLSGTSLQYIYYGENGEPIEALPDEGYHFTQWSDGCSDNPRTETNVTADTSVTANFDINTYTLTYTAGEHGSISGTSPQNVNHGSDGTAVEAIPDEGYHFTQWSDGCSDNPRTETNVTADTSVTANFEINTYTLTYSAGEHGSISGTTSQNVNHGSDGTAVEAIPDEGYHFTQWSDGCSDNPRTETNVTADTSVTANFEINTYTLTYTAGENGSISGTTPQNVNHGSDGTAVEAIPDDGYEFSQWSDSCTNNPRTDTSVTQNINVTANFTEAASLDENISHMVKLYPNPTNGIIHYESNNVEILKIKVTDITGKILLERSNLNFSGNMNISSLSQGLYLINIKTKQGSLIIKLIKE